MLFSSFRRVVWLPLLIITLSCSVLLQSPAAQHKGKKGVPEKPVTESRTAKTGRTAKASDKIPPTNNKALASKSSSAKSSEKSNEKSKDVKATESLARKGSEKSVAKKDSRSEKADKPGKQLLAKADLKADVKARHAKGDKKNESRNDKKSEARNAGNSAQVAGLKTKNNVVEKESSRASGKFAKEPKPLVQARVVSAGQTVEKLSWKQPVNVSAVRTNDSEVVRETVRQGKFGKPVNDNSSEKEIAVRTVPRTPEEEREAARKAEAELLKTLMTVKESAVTWPDRIEVSEYDPDKVGTDLTGKMRPANSFIQPSQTFNVSSKRISVSIEADRITEIQQALREKGFFQGETTGTWDDITIDAMKRFQISQKIDATGYPTAHALKKLGLTNW